MPNLQIFVVLFIVFVSIRLKWNQAWTSSERKSYHTKRELLTTGVFSLLLLTLYVAWMSSSILNFATITSPVTVQYIGCILAVLGVLLLGWVHHHLGKNFSPHLELREEHTLIQSGPYQYIRHPMYTSGFLYLVGSGLLAANWLVLMGPTLAFFVLVQMRISDEEKMLQQRFGQHWKSYKAKTGRFFISLK